MIYTMMRRIYKQRENEMWYGVSRGSCRGETVRQDGTRQGDWDGDTDPRNVTNPRLVQWFHTIWKATSNASNLRYSLDNAKTIIVADKVKIILSALNESHLRSKLYRRFRHFGLFGSLLQAPNPE
jgi:hypothetical protein